MPLINRADSLLIVVDTQPGFFGSDEPPAAALQARAVAVWLTSVAVALDIPVVVTEEDPARNGPTDASLTQRLAPGTPTFVKPIFGLADVPEILAAVEATARRTAVIVGSETDVCVSQSAIGLHDRGFRVVVVSDATYSPGDMHQLGLSRMRDAGLEISHAKGVYYEWIRDVAGAWAFDSAHPDVSAPPGFSL